MNIQYILVLTIVLGAAAFAVNMFWQKVKTTAKKGDCGSDCGCGSNAKE